MKYYICYLLIMYYSNNLKKSAIINSNQMQYDPKFCRRRNKENIININIKRGLNMFSA